MAVTTLERTSQDSGTKASLRCSYCGRLFDTSQGRANHERFIHGRRDFSKKATSSAAGKPAPPEPSPGVRSNQRSKQRGYVVLTDDRPVEELKEIALARASARWHVANLRSLEPHQVGDWAFVIVHFDVMVKTGFEAARDYR